MYSTQAVSRPEISAWLEEARKADTKFIAQRIFPVHGVTARAGRYPRIRIAKGNLLRREQTKRSSTGTYNETTQEHEWDTYDCEDRGLEQRVDDTKVEEMKSFTSLERLAAANVRRKNMLEFEFGVRDQLFNDNVFTAANATVAYTEANIATIDFPQDINGAIEEVSGRGEEVNTVVMSMQFWNRVRRSTLLQQYVYGTLGNHVQKRMLTPKDLGEAFAAGSDMNLQFIIGAAKYDTSNKGRSTSSLVPIWTNDYFWVGNVQGGDFENGGAGRTLVWEADVPSGLYATETYRDEKRRSDMVRVRTNSVEKVVSENAGHLITTNWA